MHKIPSFFKFFNAGEDNIDMEIPIAFIHCMDDPVPEEVYLRDRNNHRWTVKVATNGNRWFFVDGWSKFAKDNSLTSRDLLVFAYISKNLFNVKLYGTCATEKNISENDVQNQVLMMNGNNDGIGGNIRQRRRAPNLYPKCYGMEIFEAGLAEKPEGPYFVTKFKPKRMSDLSIPMYVIKDYNHTLGEEITLVDPEGREFPSNCQQWRDGRFLVSGGWAPLCKMNQVNEDDKCICEFVQREADHRQFLHISFVRNYI